jgi:hypothetical protein
VREEWIKNAKIKFKGSIEQAEKLRTNGSELVEVIFKKIPKIQQQIRQTLHVLEGISQSSEALI